MYNKGIMSHLSVLIAKVRPFSAAPWFVLRLKCCHQISNTIHTILIPSQPPSFLSDGQLQARKHLQALTENVITLIWSLAEASNKTLQAVNAARVEGLLVDVLEGKDVLGVQVALAACETASRVWADQAAQALYSLSQDNPEFANALLSIPAALPALVNIAQEGPDGSGAKGKGKAKGTSNGDMVKKEDGRELLCVLVCGRCMLFPIFWQAYPFAGVLCNIVDPGSPANRVVDIALLTHTVILPLLDRVLLVDLHSIVRLVEGSAFEKVSYICRYLSLS